MPTDNTTKNAAAAPVLDPAKHNAEIAQKVRDQDISGHTTTTGEFGEATEALDKLASQVPDPSKVVPKPDAGTPPPPKPKPDAGIPPKPDAGTPAPPKPDASTPPKPTAEEEKVLKRAEELFKGSPSLPPNASPKSSEAFSAIKVRAAQEISQKEQEIENLKKQLEDSKKPSPELLQQQKELDEHRQWRAKLDVEYDPKFKEFDKTIDQTRDFIYAQLAKSPAFTPEMIEQIKKYGGPDMVNLSKVFENAKDPVLQRLVEAKIADIEMAKYNKGQAVASAKGNLSKYLEERQQESTRVVEETRKKTESSLVELLGKLDWLVEKKVEDSADEVSKKEASEHNEFVTTLKKQISDAVADDSPEMRAILITGMAQLFNLQRRVPILESQLAAAQKELADTKTRWEAVKNSSRSRLNESQASDSTKPAPPKVDVHTRASDALDAIAKQIVETRASASASGQ